jgi:short-subunit dehydrogenase
MSAQPSKRALVTGGAMGLGKALCANLIEQGWDVTIIDRDATKITKKDQTLHIKCDLSDTVAVDRLIEELTNQDPFDLVVHNAAVSATGRFETIPVQKYHQLMQLNVTTPMIISSRLAAAGRFNRGAHLVFLSSLSHFTGYPGAAVYSASKDAIAVYAKSIRKPFAKIGVTVSCVFPGPMKTQQAERHSPTNADAEKRMQPETAAALILKSVFANRKTILPGANAKAFAALGKVMPIVTDFAMRKIIYEKLDKDVY